MNTREEFSTIDLILDTSFETRAIDSYALAIIKFERQVRRIFCFLIYQHPNHEPEDVKMLRVILGENRGMYFDNFIERISVIVGEDWRAEYGQQFNNDLDKLRIYQKEK